MLLYSWRGPRRIWNIFTLLSDFAYAFYVVYLSKSCLQNIPPLQLAFWLFLLVSVEVGVVSGITGQLDFALTDTGWVMAIVFPILHAYVATTFFQIGVKYIGPQSASLLSTFEPLTSILAGVIFFQEPLSLRDSLGAACILISVVILSHRHKI